MNLHAARVGITMLDAFFEIGLGSRGYTEEPERDEEA